LKYIHARINQAIKKQMDMELTFLLSFSTCFTLRCKNEWAGEKLFTSNVQHVIVLWNALWQIFR